MRTSPCKGCGAPMVWARNENGRAIPLDAEADPDEYPAAPIYSVVDVGHGDVQAVKVERGNEDPSGTFLVSHFATCPKAGEFSKRKRTTEVK